MARSRRFLRGKTVCTPLTCVLNITRAILSGSEAGFQYDMYSVSADRRLPPCNQVLGSAVRCIILQSMQIRPMSLLFNQSLYIKMKRRTVLKPASRATHCQPKSPLYSDAWTTNLLVPAWTTYLLRYGHAWPSCLQHQSRQRYVMPWIAAESFELQACSMIQQRSRYFCGASSVLLLQNRCLAMLCVLSD